MPHLHMARKGGELQEEEGPSVVGRVRLELVDAEGPADGEHGQVGVLDHLLHLLVPERTLCHSEGVRAEDGVQHRRTHRVLASGDVVVQAGVVQVLHEGQAGKRRREGASVSLLRESLREGKLVHQAGHSVNLGGGHGRDHRK